MRVDVVDRHCKVIEDEVNKLKNTLYTTSESLKDIKGKDSVTVISHFM